MSTRRECDGRPHSSSGAVDRLRSDNVGPAPRIETDLHNDAPTGLAQWHAIWTRSRHEPTVCKELSARGIDVFFPTVTRVSRWSDRAKRVEWPLFPGYCFARFAPTLLGNVFRCTGVVTVLSNGGHPVPIPASEIEALQQTMASGVEYGPCSQLVPGDKVRVTSGPLTGVVGRLVRKGPQQMLVLAVELLNSGASVQVSGWDIEPV